MMLFFFKCFIILFIFCTFLMHNSNCPEQYLYKGNLQNNLDHYLRTVPISPTMSGLSHVLGRVIRDEISRHYVLETR